MTKFILTLLISFSLTFTFGQVKPKGRFVGLVPIKDFSDPVKPNYKWYHLSELTFINDSVFLELKPIAIYKKDTIFSSSDGGIYSYTGSIRTFKGSTFVDLTLKSCDYCPDLFIKLIPPKLVKDSDTSKNSSSNKTVTIVEPPIIENSSVKYKSLLLEKTKDPNTLFLNFVIHKRNEKK